MQQLNPVVTDVPDGKAGPSAGKESIFPTWHRTLAAPALQGSFGSARSSILCTERGNLGNASIIATARCLLLSSWMENIH